MCPVFDAKEKWGVFAGLWGRSVHVCTRGMWLRR